MWYFECFLSDRRLSELWFGQYRRMVVLYKHLNYVRFVRRKEFILEESGVCCYPLGAIPNLPM